MTAKLTDFRQSLIRELTEFIRDQADALSLRDLYQLITDLPAVRERLRNIPVETYPYLTKQLQFLCLFIEEQLAERKGGLSDAALREAAFALRYFQRTPDLIPDSIPHMGLSHMGLLDDAIIVDIVLQRQHSAFKRSSHGEKLSRPEPNFEVDELLSIISPLRLSSFCMSLANRSSA
jgi:uncharacterized membrane protein YkvA (DUF1232 family)